MVLITNLFEYDRINTSKYHRVWFEIKLSRPLTTMKLLLDRVKPRILLFDSKETTFEFGHFRTLSGRFFPNYIIIFHKT